MFSHYLLSRKHSMPFIERFFYQSMGPLALMQVNTADDSCVPPLGRAYFEWFASSHPLAFSLCAFPSYLPSTAIFVLMARWSVDCQVPCWHCVFLRLTGVVCIRQPFPPCLSGLSILSRLKVPTRDNSPQNLPPCCTFLRLSVAQTSSGP